MMEESYVKFNVLHQETVQLDGKVKALSDDMNELLIRIETQVGMYGGWWYVAVGYEGKWL